MQQLPVGYHHRIAPDGLVAGPTRRRHAAAWRSGVFENHPAIWLPCSGHGFSRHEAEMVAPGLSAVQPVPKPA